MNIVDRSARDEKLQVFLNDLRGVGDAASLVFTAVPATALTLMGDILEAGIEYSTDLGHALREWISASYHPDWPVAEGAEKGIAIHHGRLPRSLGQLFVRLFNEGDIKALICTSTLIEGVNTSAANVFIYDKKIARIDFDFFSFANIRGRVGRMMRHFVGNAFLYHEPPQEIATDVSVPILSNPDSTTNFLVMNVDRDQLTRTGQERQQRLPLLTGFSPVLLRVHGGLGVDMLSRLNDRIKEMLRDDPASLEWTGFAQREGRIALAELGLMVAHSRRDATGVHTPKQVAWAWLELSRSTKLPTFLNWFASTFFKDDKAAGVDAAFQFLQACEFSFPRTISAVQALVQEISPSRACNFGTCIAAMECWFRPAWMKELDEAGIPLPLAERLGPFMPGVATRDAALAAIPQFLAAVSGQRPGRVPSLDSIDEFILRLAVDPDA